MVRAPQNPSTKTNGYSKPSQDLSIDSSTPLFQKQSLEEITASCEKFARYLVRLQTREIPSDDVRFQIVQSMLNHALSRKREVLRHFNYNFQYQLSGKAPQASKPGLLSPAQRIQLIVQMQALRKLIKRNRKNQFSFPSSLQLALSCFSNRQEGSPELSTTTSAAFNLAARLASRVADPCAYLVEIMGEQFVPRPFHPRFLLQMRDNMVEKQINARMSHLKSKTDHSPKERLELSALRLRSMQRKLRGQLNAAVPWSVIEAGKYKDDMVE